MKHERAMGGGLRVLGWFLIQGSSKDGEVLRGGGGGEESSLVEGCTTEQLTPQGQPTPL